MNTTIKRYSAADVPEAGRPGFWVHAGEFNQAMELAANREAALQQRLNIADQRVCDLQSELTKALSLVRWFYTHANVHQVGTAMMDAARDFIAHQSASAAKACSHIWVSADNRGAGAGEICQACPEHRPAAKLDASMIGIVHTPPMEYDEP